MIPFFIFNDINSKDLGIVVNELPPISKAQRNYEEKEIPGRNGKLYIDNKSYKPFQYKIKCTLIKEDSIRNMSKWLNGSGTLVISTEPDKFYNVIIKNKIDFAQVYHVCKEFTINFEVQPIAYGLEEKSINISEETELTITESTHDIKPYLKITGSGDVTLTINNKNVILYNIEDYIELDCEMEEAFKDTMNCNDKIYCDEFPELHPGENYINWIGNVSNLQIKYREAFV